MDFFTIMVWIAVIMAVAAGYLWWKLKKTAGQRVTVSYSENINNAIVECGDNYAGFINEKADTLSIPKLDLKRPVPPRKAFLPTFGGGKKIYLVKIGNNRYGYRIPSLKNHIFVQKRDEEGNLIFQNNKPVFVKHQWALCDDVIEPDAVHWEENYADELRQRRMDRKNFWEKLGPVAAIAVIAVCFIIGSKFLSDNFKSMTTAVTEDAKKMQSEAQKTQQNLNTMIEKITGQKILQDSPQVEQQKRDEFHEEAKG